MMQAPDGNGRLELVKFHSPSSQGDNRHAPANTPVKGFVDKIPKHERDRVRRDLLECCQRDALAMVRLVETLEGLARVAP
jgi:hypothetical protein